MNEILTASLIGYVLGCIQASYIIGRSIRKIDIREHGSTNAGASNATMVLGWRWGLVTFIIDFSKAAIAVLLVRFFFSYGNLPVFLAGIFAVLGHIFPMFLRFRGGKGIASLLGMFIAFNWQIGLIIAVIQILVSLATDYIAVGSIVLYAALPILVYLFDYPPVILWLTLILTLIGFLKHIPNIIKIRNGDEKGIRLVLFKKQC